MEIRLVHKVKIYVRVYDYECGININVIAKLLWNSVTTNVQLILHA
jgi:hypothetical protein